MSGTSISVPKVPKDAKVSRCRAVVEAVGPMPLPGRYFPKPLIWGVVSVLEGDMKGQRAMLFAERRIWGYPVEASPHKVVLNRIRFFRECFVNYRVLCFNQNTK